MMMEVNTQVQCYWMPVDWTGVGIHDSDWQPAYGGDLWKTRYSAMAV